MEYRMTQEELHIMNDALGRAMESARKTADQYQAEGRQELTGSWNKRVSDIMTLRKKVTMIKPGEKIIIRA